MCANGMQRDGYLCSYYIHVDIYSFMDAIVTADGREAARSTARALQVVNLYHMNALQASRFVLPRYECMLWTSTAPQRSLPCSPSSLYQIASATWLPVVLPERRAKALDTILPQPFPSSYHPFTTAHSQ